MISILLRLAIKAYEVDMLKIYIYNRFISFEIEYDFTLEDIYTRDFIRKKQESFKLLKLYELLKNKEISLLELKKQYKYRLFFYNI